MKAIPARDLGRSRFKANPYPFYARLRREAPVCRISAFAFHAWMVTRYDDVAGMLSDERFSNDITRKLRWMPAFARPLTDHMLNRDVPDHTRLRKLVTRAFTPKRVEGLRGLVESLCGRLLEAAAARGSLDVAKSYALTIPVTVISEMLGIPEAERRRFYVLTRGAFKLGAPAGVADVTLTLPYAWLLVRYFRKLFAERRARPTHDLLAALVQAEEDGDRLTEDELLGMAVLLLIAGYETTVGLIAVGAHALLEHPKQLARWMEDRGGRGAAIDELLRFASPVELTPPRVTVEDVRIGDVTIPRGDMVTAAIGSANHDETHFAEPDQLDLGRDPNPHLAFGDGRHFCLGASLARMEAQIALSHLFERFPKMRLARPTEALRWRAVVPLRSLDELPVVLA